ncbi:hypothetical protein GT043_39270, partial [Streptomyces sp. SID2131]|nr:hypothetical protein [Streptomyces sp. SID2131]
TPALGLQLHHLAQLAPRLLDTGFTRAELDRLEALMHDPGFAAATGVLYSVQGRRPAGHPPVHRTTDSPEAT